MKNKVFILLLLTLVATSAVRAQVRFGVKGGMNLATLTGDDSKTKPSFYVGGLLTLPLGFISLQPEVTYSRQGAYFRHAGTKTWMRYNYLNVPVMVRLTLLKVLSIEAGPQAGFVVGAVQRTKAGGEVVKKEIDERDYHTADFSLAMGFSVRVDPHTEVNFRYNAGLTDVSRTSESTPSATSTNSVFQFGLSYRF